MGNSDSKETSYGYRIIKVAPGSPAQKAGLIEFLDYIIDVSTSNDKTPFTGNYGEFFKIIQNSEDKETTMKVYNILYRKTRIVTLIPSKKWENSDSLLGALVRYEEYASAHERALRIATVHPNSPASIAGLEPEIDYVLGSPQYLYTDLNELANFIEMTQEKETIKSLELYIYNSQTNAVRSTLIIPNRNWGGEGHLGCEFALGILNHLPQLEDEIPVSNLGETAPLTGIDTSHTSPLGDKVDRLDESPLQLQPRGLEKSLSEERTLEDQVLNPKPTSSQEPSDLSAAPKSEAIPEFKLRPPTSSEVEHNKAAHDAHTQKPTNFDLSHELTNQRMKLLHLGHQYKVPSKGPQRPAIKSGRSTANPFHNPEDTPTKNGGLSSPFSQVAQVSHEQPVHEKTVPIEEVPVVKGEDHGVSAVTQPSENAASQPHQHAHEQVHQEPQQAHEHVKEQVHEHLHEQNLEKEKSARKSSLAEVESKPQVEKVEEKKHEPEVKKIELNGNSRMHNETPVVMRVEKTPSSPVKEMRRLISNEEVKTENNGKPIHGGETQEKHAYRTTIEYNFFSKKLSGEYKILSSNLFDLDAPLKAKNSK